MNWSVPENMGAGSYARPLPPPVMLTVPWAPFVVATMCNASPSRSVSLANTGMATAGPVGIVMASSSATGGSLPGPR